MKNVGFEYIICINKKINKYRIYWDCDTKHHTDILHKPTLAEIKSIVLNGMNAIIDESIISGFMWNNMPVWLSTENQFNYKAAYDLAVQTNGANLPTVFKFGSSEEPIYHKFDTLEELSDFYMKAMTYINEQLAIGWAKKDAIDWSVYEDTLNNLK
jgi:hypothetical protein